MRVLSIELDADGLPEAVTLRATALELALVAKRLGSISTADHDAFLPGLGAAASELYEQLVGLVFNPYHEGGLDEAARRRP